MLGQPSFADLSSAALAKEQTTVGKSTFADSSSAAISEGGSFGG